MHNPFPYQHKSVDVTAQRFREGHRRVLNVMPCGAGKTTVIAMRAAAAEAKGTSMMVLAHRRILVKQIAERLKGFGVNYSCIMAELPELEQAPWAIYNPNARIYVASMQTLDSRKDSAGVPQVLTLSIDECHNLEDNRQYQRAAALTGSKFLIGDTATPIRADGSGLGAKNWDCLDSIITIEELIQLKRLVEIQTYGPLKMMERRKRGEKTTRAGDPVEQWKMFADGKRTIVFSRNRRESIGVCDDYCKAGIPAIHVDGTMPHDERDKAFKSVAAGENLVLCTVALVKEGFDLPELECCQLLTSAVSPRVFWQNVGRIQRACGEKLGGILLDHSGATAIHGLPNVSPTWSLADNDSIQARERAKQDKDPTMKPRMCKQCGAISAGAGKCPNCGASLIVQVKAEVDTERENLQEVQSSSSFDNKGDPQKKWASILFMAAARGMTCGAAAGMFKKQFGQWPDAANVRPTAAPSDAKLLVRELFPQFDRRKGGAA